MYKVSAYNRLSELNTYPLHSNARKVGCLSLTRCTPSLHGTRLPGCADKAFTKNSNNFPAALVCDKRRCRRTRRSGVVQIASGEASSEKDRINAEKQAKKVALLVHESGVLKPFDVDFNPAAYIWQQIEEISPEYRHLLLDYLENEDITKLWKIAGTRYSMASQLQWNAATNFAFDPIKELRGEKADPSPSPSSSRNTVAPPTSVVFEGKAAVPAAFIASPLKLNRFQKVFVKAPDSEDLFGRVRLGYGGLVDGRVPLYFKVLKNEAVFTTGEPADVCLVYGGQEAIPLSVELADDDSVTFEDNGKIITWPPAYDPLYPFSGLKDYMRLVAPGVFVGLGYREDSRLPPGRFLSFVLVQQYSKPLAENE